LQKKQALNPAHEVKLAKKEPLGEGLAVVAWVGLVVIYFLPTSAEIFIIFT